MVAILMMSVKLATLGLLKVKVFRNKDCDVTIFVLDVTYKILALDPNYVVDVVMWPKSVNSTSSMREVIINSVL